MRTKPPTTSNLKAVILDRFSIAEFARRTRIERTQIYTILNRKTLPGLENFMAMAEALDLPLNELAELLGVGTPGPARSSAAGGPTELEPSP